MEIHDVEGVARTQANELLLHHGVQHGRREQGLAGGGQKLVSARVRMTTWYSLVRVDAAHWPTAGSCWAQSARKDSQANGEAVFPAVARLGQHGAQKLTQQMAVANGSGQQQLGGGFHIAISNQPQAWASKVSSRLRMRVAWRFAVAGVFAAGCLGTAQSPMLWAWAGSAAGAQGGGFRAATGNRQRFRR